MKLAEAAMEAAEEEAAVTREQLAMRAEDEAMRMMLDQEVSRIDRS